MGGRGGLKKQSLRLGTGVSPTMARSKACHRSLACETLVTETLASGVSGEGAGGGFALGPWVWVVEVGPWDCGSGGWRLAPGTVGLGVEGGPWVSKPQTQGCQMVAQGAAWRRPAWQPGQLTGDQAEMSKPQNLRGLDSAMKFPASS